MTYVEVKTKDGSLGGRLSEDYKHVIVATIEDGLTIVEKIEANIDELGELLEKSGELFFKIKNFFDDLFNRLPTKIKENGKVYRLNELPAPGAAEDVVLYRNEQDGNDILFETKGRNNTKARNLMFQKLQEEGFIF